LPFQVESSILLAELLPDLMNGNHILLGIVMLAATLGTLGWRYSTQKKASVPAWGWPGLAIILLAELLLFLRLRWVEVFFTPIVWTGYLPLTLWFFGSSCPFARQGMVDHARSARERLTIRSIGDRKLE